MDQFGLCNNDDIDHVLKTSTGYKKILSRVKTFDRAKVYYEDVFKPSNAILDSLYPCDEFVNLDALEMLKEKYKTANDTRNLNIIESFFPETEHLMYSRTSSITGRQSVLTGPQILTLKKDDRKEVFNNKDLYILDFSAIEPCILFQLCGFHDLDFNDLYLSIKSYLGLEALPRDEVKSTVLKLIYGSNISHANSSHPKEAQKLNEFLSSFGALELKQKLKSELYDGGCLYNFFGKPILTKEHAIETQFQDYVLINYYVQSTAADLGLLFFSMFYNQNKTKIKPLFVIHDALVFASPAVANWPKTLSFKNDNFKVFSKLESLFRQQNLIETTT
jgi:hypothetical protein